MPSSQFQQLGDHRENYVLPLASLKWAGGAWQIDRVFGTGFLVKNGRGLGVTAGHVARSLEAASTASALFLYTGPEPGIWRAARILRLDRHPEQDVALFRLPDGDFESPYIVTADDWGASAHYELWGYPDDVHHDLATAGILAFPQLVYSEGHVRRRIWYEIPGVPGHSFFELSTPAGTCCSGAPVTVATDLLPMHRYRVFGIYVGERRNEANTLAVGFATRTNVLAAHWPELVAEDGDLSRLVLL